jgi:dTDP-4-dehydrorhamnose 3,5-epimerase
MQIERFSIEDVFIIVPLKRIDHRGFFSETYRTEALRAHGVTADFVQENHVFSAERGVLRGLHFQIPPRAQGKLVRCIRGTILDVAVDIRKQSPTYGRHVALELSGKLEAVVGTTGLCAWLHYVRVRLRGNLQSNGLLGSRKRARHCME